MKAVVRHVLLYGRLAWAVVALTLILPVLASAWLAGLDAASGAADPLLLSVSGTPSAAAWARHPLVWHAAQNLAQPWRFWGAAWVHLNVTHWWLNVTGWAVVLAFGLAARLSPRLALAWLLAWPFGHLLLALAPGLDFYAGLSGVLHAGVAVAAVGLAARAGRERRIGLAVLLGLGLKLALELGGQPFGTVVVSAWGLPVQPLAHLTGALAGVACAFGLLPRPQTS
jgi:rhomboid family GlyGly-CTERM serine protease